MLGLKACATTAWLEHLSLKTQITYWVSLWTLLFMVFPLFVNSSFSHPLSTKFHRRERKREKRGRGRERERIWFLSSCFFFEHKCKGLWFASDTPDSNSMQQQSVFILQRACMHGPTVYQDGRWRCGLCNLKPVRVGVGDFYLSFPWLVVSISRGIGAFVIG